MPKRKRDDGSGAGGSASQALSQQSKFVWKDDVERKLEYCRRLLNKSLKTAKGFERPRLAKREKLAASKGEDSEELKRIKKEIEVIKALDMTKAVEIHLYKSLLKSKSIAESDHLPHYVKTTTAKWEGDEEHIRALNNVIARMCNMKPVKEAMSTIMNTMYEALALGQPNQTKKDKQAATEKEPEIESESDTEISAVEQDGEALSPAARSGLNDVDVPWEGFESGSEESAERGELSDSEDDLSRYDDLLGSSSDPSDDDEELSDDGSRADLAQGKRDRPRRTASREMSISKSPSPSPPAAPLVRMTAAKPTTTKNSSTFLPSLMGGYWSGSEEEPTDDEDVAALPQRKNRMGQQARRALWEKKYGNNANHVKKPKPGSRDAGWDARRGAQATDDRGAKGNRSGSKGFGRESRGSKAAHMPGRESATGGNMAPIQTKPKRDDTGVLHPSWQAAKKAKDAAKTAKFEGKKVVFD